MLPKSFGNIDSRDGLHFHIFPLISSRLVYIDGSVEYINRICFPDSFSTHLYAKSRIFAEFASALDFFVPVWISCSRSTTFTSPASSDASPLPRCFRHFFHIDPALQTRQAFAVRIV
jgi:hypothetical protein